MKYSLPPKSYDNAKVTKSLLNALNQFTSLFTSDDWKKLDEDVKAMSTDPRHTVSAMSRYDAEYLRYYTGI